MLISSRLYHYITACCACLLSQTCFAAPVTTPPPPIDIQSDQLFVSQLRHLAIYTGHVIADRGKGHLTGHILKVYIDPKTHHLQRLIDTGKQATYHDIDPQSQQPIFSRADKITLVEAQHKVYLDGHAYVKKEDNIAKAPHLTYNQLTGTTTSHVDHPKTEHTDLVIMPQTPSPTVASQHTTH